MSEQRCVCGAIIDYDECQCSLASSDCIDIQGSGNGVAITADPIVDPDTDNLLSCGGDGLLVQLPFYITDPPECSAYNSSAISLTDDTGQVVALNSEYYESGSMHDNTINNSRITIVTAGIYIVTFVCSFAANGTGDRQALIRKNGNEFIAGAEKRASGASTETGMSVTTQEWLTAGEYVEAVVKQDSGGALNLLATRYSPILTATFRRLPPDE